MWELTDEEILELQSLLEKRIKKWEEYKEPIWTKTYKEGQKELRWIVWSVNRKIEKLDEIWLKLEAFKNARESENG